MTAIFTVQLTCANVDTCEGRYPGAPAVTTATELRKRAAENGWETMKGKHGREMCPACRIGEIQAAAGVREG